MSFSRMHSVIFIGLLMDTIFVVSSLPIKRTSQTISSPSHDVILTRSNDSKVANSSDEEDVLNLVALKKLWLAPGGKIFPDKADGRLEVAATPGVTAYEHQVGSYVISSMTFLMPEAVFARLASHASVGFFSTGESTTSFPEYWYLKNRVECGVSCSWLCSVTCTADGRKFDSLAGVGGQRATCLKENFMCQTGDPYFGQYSVLVHEFGHTVHMFGLSNADAYNDKLEKAYDNAKRNDIWDPNSYAMSDVHEYFAEATGVFFNSNKHPSSCGEMNRCGRQSGFCESETEARQWLKLKDPLLFDVLSYTYTNHHPDFTADLQVCVV